MSWSITLIGKPENIVAALKEQSEKLSGMSKTEFDDALPHLVGLVEQNFNTTTTAGPVINLTASGHGYDNYRQCTVSIQPLAGNLV